jgi:hypothetical protein
VFEATLERELKDSAKEKIMASIEGNEVTTTSGTDFEEVPVRELSTSYPIFWFLLPEGPERDALKLKQETPRKHFNR